MVSESAIFDKTLRRVYAVMLADFIPNDMQQSRRGMNNLPYSVSTAVHLCVAYYYYMSILILTALHNVMQYIVCAVKPLLKDTYIAIALNANLNKQDTTACSVPFDVPCIDIYTYK